MTRPSHASLIAEMRQTTANIRNRFHSAKDEIPASLVDSWAGQLDALEAQPADHGEDAVARARNAVLKWFDDREEYITTEEGETIARAVLAEVSPVDGWSSAARDVLTERQRQVDKEGWSIEHDDQHTGGELSQAAACYARQAFWTSPNKEHPINRPWGWPWEPEAWRPKTARRDLVRAAALILAEIERLDRLPPPPTQEKTG